MVDGMVVDGRTVNARIAEFSIENRFNEVDMTQLAGQTVVSDAGRVATTDELYRGTVASAIGNTDFIISGTPITFSNQYLGMYATFYDDGDDGKTNSTVLIDLTETNDFLGTLAPGFTVAAGDVVVISKTMPGQALTGADGDTLETLSDQIDGPVTANITQVAGQSVISDGAGKLSSTSEIWTTTVADYSTINIDLTDGPSSDGAFGDRCVAVLYGDGTLNVRRVISYTGMSSTMVIDTEFNFNPVGKTIRIFAAPPGLALTGADGDTLKTLSDQMDTLVTPQSVRAQLKTIVVELG